MLFINCYMVKGAVWKVFNLSNYYQRHLALRLLPFVVMSSAWLTDVLNGWLTDWLAAATVLNKYNNCLKLLITAAVSSTFLLSNVKFPHNLISRWSCADENIMRNQVKPCAMYVTQLVYFHVYQWSLPQHQTYILQSRSFTKNELFFHTSRCLHKLLLHI